MWAENPPSEVLGTSNRNRSHAGPDLPGRPPVLAKPVGIRSLEDRSRFFIVCANATGGIIATTQRHTEPRLMKGLVFEATDAAMGPVEFHLQIVAVDSRLSHGTRKAYRFHWLAISARKKRSFLVETLRSVCGINARVSSTDDVLSEHRVLVYDAMRKQVRLINVGESVLPPQGAQLISATPSIRQGGDPNRVLTQPRVLLGAGGRPAVGARAPHERARVVAAAGAPRPVKADRASYVPKDPTAVRTAIAPLPVHPRPLEAGLIRMDGRRYRADFGWVGHTHLVLILPSTVDVRVGNGLGLSVPCQPLSDEVLDLKGVVSRTTGSEGTLMVEVDLRVKGGATQPLYAKLVEFFFHRSKSARR